MEPSSLYCYHLSHSVSPKLAFLTPTNHPNHKLYIPNPKGLKKIQHHSKLPLKENAMCMFAMRTLRLQQHQHQDASITKSTGHRTRGFQHGNVLAGWIHPGRLTWNIQITHLERKMIFQTSMIMFHVNLPGCIKHSQLAGVKKPLSKAVP